MATLKFSVEMVFAQVMEHFGLYQLTAGRTTHCTDSGSGPGIDYREGNCRVQDLRQIRKTSLTMGKVKTHSGEPVPLSRWRVVTLSALITDTGLV